MQKLLLFLPLLPNPLAILLATHDCNFTLLDIPSCMFPFITVLSLSLLLLYLIRRPPQIYLINFSCYKPDETFKQSCEAFVERSIAVGTFTPENVEFQKKILERSGLGQCTYLPKAATTLPLDLRMVQARWEAELVIYGAIDELLKKTVLKMEEVGVVVVNCSLFCPTPSLADMVANRYGLKEDVVSYSLSGMGCSAGIIAIDVAKQLLKVHRSTYALIVSTENLTLHGYYGNNRSMLVTNCLFRMGGAAILLSNRRSDRHRAKYLLSTLVRTHMGASPSSFHCIRQQEDDAGKVGVALSKDLMSVAASSLKSNLTSLGPRVLPLIEQLKFLTNLLVRTLAHGRVEPYVPNFKLALEHFCIHAGGRAVLDALQERLELEDWQMEPSRMTLYRFGNTSSSSLWYELAYAEAKGRMKKGDRVWQVGFGSGFKCNSVVWKALKDVEKERRWPWCDEIDEFPVLVPKIASVAV